MNRTKRGFTVMELLVTLIVYPIIVTALAFWTQRNMDFWATHFAGHPVHVPFILDWLLCLVAPAMFTANVIAEILRFFM
jgi:prepilin-type N-terminal cleavage/methylation domain-containing protein